MATPFLGEIKLVAFGFAPKGWALCNGQLLPINQNQALFSILGTTYGGDGRVNFALPNLQGRSPVHTGNGIVTGEAGGEAAHTLNLAELPAHTHAAQGSTNAPNTGPANGFWAAQSSYSTAPPDGALTPAALSPVGGSQPHVNLQPYLVLNFVIALQGIFPSRN